MSMKQIPQSKLSGRYLAALRTHFEQGPQAGLQAAHDLGTQAAIYGLAMPDLVQMHVQALAALVLPANERS